MPGSDAFQDDAGTESWGAQAAGGFVSSNAVLCRHAERTLRTKEAGAKHSQSDALPLDAVPPSRPLVGAPEFGDRVQDTDKEPFWIPGAVPNG